MAAAGVGHSPPSGEEEEGLGSGRTLQCAAYLCENYPREWLDLPHLSCYRATAEQPYTEA